MGKSLTVAAEDESSSDVAFNARVDTSMAMGESSQERLLVPVLRNESSAGAAEDRSSSAVPVDARLGTVTAIGAESHERLIVPDLMSCRGQRTVGETLRAAFDADLRATDADSVRTLAFAIGSRRPWNCEGRRCCGTGCLCGRRSG